MLALILKYKMSIIGVFIGGAGGYAYYKYIGCTSGTCPITSNPYVSTIYGIIVGYLLLSSFDK